jgi:hypothetical protein
MADWEFIKKSLTGSRLSYDCPRCEEHLQAKLSEAGTEETCPQCGVVYIVPGTEEVAELQRTLAAKKEQKRKEQEEKARIRNERARPTEEEAADDSTPGVEGETMTARTTNRWPIIVQAILASIVTASVCFLAYCVIVANTAGHDWEVKQQRQATIYELEDARLKALEEEAAVASKEGLWCVEQATDENGKFHASRMPTDFTPFYESLTDDELAALQRYRNR